MVNVLRGSEVYLISGPGLKHREPQLSTDLEIKKQRANHGTEGTEETGHQCLWGSSTLHTSGRMEGQREEGQFQEF